MGGKGGRCLRLGALSPSCADCLQILEPQPSVIFTDCPGLYVDCSAFTIIDKLLSNSEKKNYVWVLFPKDAVISYKRANKFNKKSTVKKSSFNCGVS